MGAERFDVYQEGTNVKAAHNAAFEQAGYDYGHRGYTGSLAEKPEFEMRNGGKSLKMEEAKAFAEKDLDENDHDKWGPAWVIPIKEDSSEKTVGFLFYGYASS